MRLLAILIAASLALGCAGSFEEARGQRSRLSLTPLDRCVSLDAEHRTWGGVAAASAVLAGGTGLSTVAIDDVALKTTLALGAAVAGATAAAATYVSQDAASSWARACSR